MQQQKAVLALAQEQMQIIELERRLVQAEAERGVFTVNRAALTSVMRDHRISLFQTREAEVTAEMEEKDARLEGLEVSSLIKFLSSSNVQAELGKARASAGQQSASDRKARVALEAKVQKLEAKIQAMSATEKDLRQEVDLLLESEKSNDNSVSVPARGTKVRLTMQADKEKRQLQVALKAAKSDLATKTDDLGDLQEELTNFKESSKEREKTLKQKLKEVTLEKDRLAGLEVGRTVSSCEISLIVRTN